MVLFIILLILFCLVLLGEVIYCFIKPHEIGIEDAICIIIVGIVLGMCISEKVLNNGPSAIDVYRGKTELEIMSINGVPKDTTVVYKK